MEQTKVKVSKLGGRIQYFFPKWKTLTTNKKVLQSVQGYKIPLKTIPEPNMNRFNFHPYSDQDLISKCIKNLLDQGIIEKVTPTRQQFLSPFFIVQKSNKKPRFILNLKSLNSFLSTDHFKMEDYRTALKLIHQGSYMCTIDLKDAYYTVPVYKDHRQFLSFKFNNEIYEYLTLPFGLASAPHAFTKLTKPILAWLRKQGITCVLYLDDFLIIDREYHKCKYNTRIVLKILLDLGFIVNLEKSKIEPTTECTYLGYIFNSERMIIFLPDEKKLKILNFINEILKQELITIRFFAQFIGTLVSACPAVKYSWLYTKNFEKYKIWALFNNKNNFNARIVIPASLIPDLHWWKDKIMTSFNNIRDDEFDLELVTDSSLTGWGAVCNNISTYGWWSAEERHQHINFLELKAILLGLKSFTSNLQSKNILIRVDNTTALAYINKMGSVKFPKLSTLAREIWQFCEQRDLWLYASYIPSIENIADRQSRSLPTETEYELNPKIFQEIVKIFGNPERDLFASYLNAKCKEYYSWHPDPGSLKIDAFTVGWSDIFFYAFPPFCLILRTLNKIKLDQATGIMVVPKWPTQAWYPLWKKLLITTAIEYPSLKEPIIYPFSCPNKPKITLEVGLLSGKPF